MNENIFTDIWRFVSNRLFITTLIVLLLFYMLAAKLFDLQIVNGEYHESNLSVNIARTISLPAQRGSIYDRYGRPLAINDFGYSVLIDPSVIMESSELNDVLYHLVKLLDQNGEEFIDELPITTEAPYEFTFYSTNSEGQERRWKKDMDINEKLTAEETVNVLMERFGIDKDLPHSDSWKILSIRSKLYQTRYYSYNLVTLAMDVSIDTVTNIEEDSVKYKSLQIDKEALRNYPGGETMSHILGYVRTVSSDDGTAEELSERGYSLTDIIGKDGIERAFEESLRGEAGSQTVIVNNVGRRVGVVEESRVDPVQGDRVYLTIDSEFQEKCYEILVDILKETLINKMTVRSTKHDALTARDILQSLVSSNNISAKDVFESEEGTYSYKVREYVLSVLEEADPNTRDGRVKINGVIAQGIEDGKVSTTDILMVLYEQDIITADESYLARIRTGAISSTQVVIDKIRDDEITPQMANVDPSTASLVVVDVNTGSVLAAPTYPTYDNNEFMTNFNQAYLKLLDDPTSPLLNRPFYERRAPGSTFKMISAITGLETGVINLNTKIYDEIEFTKAGKPTLRCWNRVGGHGAVNVVSALEVSCNYFFADTVYRLGNLQSGNTLDAINTLNDYMRAFDLDQTSGVEIYELPPILSSPETKFMLYENNPNESTDWYDGNTTHTSIGQGFSSYNTAVMAKYTAAVATKGKKYDLHLLDKTVTDSGAITNYIPVQKDMGIEISDTSWSAVHQGMLDVTQGSQGTARGIFSNYPIAVAGKTGTAEEIRNRSDHTSFAGFAPYDNPQIAVYVAIPFSDTDTTTSPASLVGKAVISEYFRFDSEIETPLAQNTIVK